MEQIAVFAPDDSQNWVTCSWYCFFTYKLYKTKKLNTVLSAELGSCSYFPIDVGFYGYDQGSF